MTWSVHDRKQYSQYFFCHMLHPLLSASVWCGMWKFQLVLVLGKIQLYWFSVFATTSPPPTPQHTLSLESPFLWASLSCLYVLNSKNCLQLKNCVWWSIIMSLSFLWKDLVTIFTIMVALMDEILKNNYSPTQPQWVVVYRIFFFFFFWGGGGLVCVYVFVCACVCVHVCVCASVSSQNIVDKASYQCQDYFQRIGG